MSTKCRIKIIGRKTVAAETMMKEGVSFYTDDKELSSSINRYITRGILCSQVIKDDSGKYSVYLKTASSVRFTATLLMSIYTSRYSNSESKVLNGIEAEIVSNTDIESLGLDFKSKFIVPIYGSTNDLNNYALPIKGCIAYNDTLQKAVIGNGTAWINMDGTSLEESTALNNIEEIPASEDKTN